METKQIPITEDTILDHDEIAPMGPVMLELPEGPALCHDAVSCTAITAIRPASGEKFIAIINAADFWGHRLGALAQFTPDQARNFAASLIRSANEIDGGKELD